jgi:hypothetical protein
VKDIQEWYGQWLPFWQIKSCSIAWHGLSTLFDVLYYLCMPVKNYFITESSGCSTWTTVTRLRAVTTSRDGMCDSCRNKALNCQISWLHYYVPEK